jgi:5-(carboxyamino)imidazole ribonucleotide synthase
MRLASPLPPGSTIGILGGGQLGRMLALAAARLGLKCHIYAPEADSPAFQVAAAHTIAGYTDFTALESFARAVDAVTYEFENVPGETAAFLAPRVPLAPSARTLQIAQDRVKEKIRCRAWHSVAPLPPFMTKLAAAIKEIEDRRSWTAKVDGKAGENRRQEAAAAWAEIAKRRPCWRAWCASTRKSR